MRAEWERRRIGRAHLFGISLGGMIAQWVAIDAPATVARLVLASTTSRGMRAVADAGLRGLALARCLALPEGDTSACLVEGVLSESHIDPASRGAAATAAHDHARSTSDLLWLAAAAAAHDAGHALRAVNAPTLILSGEHDRLIAPGTQARLLRHIPDARQVTIPGAGHDLTLDRPRLTAERVARFLEVET